MNPNKVVELTGHHDGCGLTELCHVLTADDPHPVNGAHHSYEFLRSMGDGSNCSLECKWNQDGQCCDPGPDFHDKTDDFPADCQLTCIPVGYIQFQRGPRNESDSTPGTLDGAVLSVLIHRQECFQAGPFACPGNDAVLEHLRAARSLMIARAQERAKRGVLGKNVK